ncbi:MAG TPA: MoxR family ATPase [Kofleriaceae bacterium]|jgi:MoxR-like ATPase|nr:MoxR family ATPase [Kofleriaceae bacterium]
MTDSSTSFMQYRGRGAVPPGGKRLSRRGQSGRYLASEDLALAVNTALAVEQPLLLTGEPGTGKTELAWSIAEELGLGEVEEFHTRSDSEATDLLYRFDNVRRFADAHRGRDEVEQLDRYVALGPLGRALESGQRRVVLIDEIDKAPRDFPNDLLDVIDQMSFLITETGKRIPDRDPERDPPAPRPIVIITSNVERQLPDPFLRRCVYHHIEPPDGQRLAEILRERLADLRIEDQILAAAIKRYEGVRQIEGLRKKPATHELISWVKVLVRAGVKSGDVAASAVADLYPGALLKTREDIKQVQARERSTVA